MDEAQQADGADADRRTATWDASQRGPVRRYKGHGKGPMKAVRCVACFPRSVAGQMIPLRYGVTIALCEDHRDPAFVHSRGGRDFLAAMTTTFESLGLRGGRYRKAVQAFVADVLAMGTPTPRHRPGSYAWPEQRQAAEAIWADGGTYHDGEAVVDAYFAQPSPRIPPPSPPPRPRRAPPPPAGRGGAAGPGRPPGPPPPPRGPPVDLRDRRPVDCP